MNEIELSTAGPPKVRLKEAVFFRDKFITACGPPLDSNFEMIVYFDAFLFTIVSIEEMVERRERQKLQASDVFLFLKAARNVTTHHSVLAAPNQPKGFAHPLPRQITEHVGGAEPFAYARFVVSTDNFRAVFRHAAASYPQGRRNFELGECYLDLVDQRGKKEFYLEDVMQEGIDAVADILGT